MIWIRAADINDSLQIIFSDLKSYLSQTKEKAKQVERFKELLLAYQKDNCSRDDKIELIETLQEGKYLDAKTSEVILKHLRKEVKYIKKVDL